MATDANTPVLQSKLSPLAVVSVAAPYRKPGNVIEHLPVRFEVFRRGRRFTAVPFCSEADKRLANLPDVLMFEKSRYNVICKSAADVFLVAEIMAEWKKTASPMDKQGKKRAKTLTGEENTLLSIYRSS